MLSADTLTADVVARVELADGWLEQIFDDFPLPEEADLEPDDREMECDDFINSVKIFAPGGELRTPWGAGRWGPTEADDILYADFVGMKHQLTFDAGFAKFTSARCGDGEPVLGKLDRK